MDRKCGVDAHRTREQEQRLFVFCFFVLALLWLGLVG